MNNDKLNEILKFLTGEKNLKVVLLTILVIFGLVLAWQRFVVPLIMDWNGGTKAIKEAEAEIISLEKQIKEKKLEKKMNQVQVKDVDVTIYKPKYSGLSIESSAIDFVTNLIVLLEKTNNEILDLSYNSDPNISAPEPIPNGVKTIRFYLEMNSTYTSFYQLINELYSLDYLVTIKTIKLEPLKENKNTLHADMIIWLYVKS